MQTKPTRTKSVTWNLRHWNPCQSLQDPQRVWRERLWAPSWSYHWEDKIECGGVSAILIHLSVSRWGLCSLRSSLRGPSLKSPSPSLRWSSRVASESREESSLPCASRRALVITNVIAMPENRACWKIPVNHNVDHLKSASPSRLRSFPSSLKSGLQQKGHLLQSAIFTRFATWVVLAYNQKNWYKVLVQIKSGQFWTDKFKWWRLKRCKKSTSNKLLPVFNLH